MEENLLLITKLEDACISARYLPRRVERREAEELVGFAEKLWRMMEDV